MSVLRTKTLCVFNSEISPFLCALVAADQVVDKGQAADAIFYAGEVEGFFGRGGAVDAGHEGDGEVAVEVGEGFEITFGVAARGAGIELCDAGEIAIAGAIDLGWLVEPFYQQGMGFLLCPFDAAVLAIDADL